MTGMNPWTHKNCPRIPKTKKLSASAHIPSLNTVHSNHILWTIHLCAYIFYSHRPHVSWPLWLFMLCSTTHSPQPQLPLISDGGRFIHVYTSHHISCCTHTHPAPSTTTIGEAVHSCLFFAMRQGDEEIPLENLSQPPLAHLKDRVEKELPQDVC